MAALRRSETSVDEAAIRSRTQILTLQIGIPSDSPQRQGGLTYSNKPWDRMIIRFLHMGLWWWITDHRVERKKIDV